MPFFPSFFPQDGEDMFSGKDSQSGPHEDAAGGLQENIENECFLIFSFVIKFEITMKNIIKYSHLKKGKN